MIAELSVWPPYRLPQSTTHTRVLLYRTAVASISSAQIHRHDPSNVWAG